VEVIPLEELGRPRIDVTLRTSGFFRDAFPNLMELFDQAVRMVALLKEPEEKNYLAAHFRRDLKEHLARGLSREEASRRASLRVFSDPPGAYGTGMSQVLDTGSWNDRRDLAEVYLKWGGYAYGEGIYGLEAREDFSRALSRVEVTYRNDDTREIDLLSCDCPNAYHGGLNAAVEALSGKRPLSYSGSTADPERPEVKTTAEEIRFLFRTKVLNPRWIEGMKRHGYKGAGDLSRLIDYCFQWDATSDVLSDWMYEKLAETYAFSEEMQTFFLKHNPAALLNIAERLLEAARRGLWKASKEYLERLENLFLEMEAILE
jgi:cobaltochelatase CobN